MRLLILTTFPVSTALYILSTKTNVSSTIAGTIESILLDAKAGLSNFLIFFDSSVPAIKRLVFPSNGLILL